jgi:outer membrane receptor protein involved in Fe transport
MPSYLLALLVLLLLLAGAAPARAQGEQEGQPTPAEDSTGAEAEEDEELDLGVIHVEADALPPPAPAPAPAEEVEEEEAPEAEPEAVEVVPTGPAVEAVIERERLEATAADSLDEVLQRESGFVVNDTFAGSEASYQGLPGKFSAVTVDGQRLPGQLFDQVDFGQLQLGNVERVEVIRGPQPMAPTPPAWWSTSSRAPPRARAAC